MSNYNVYNNFFFNEKKKIIIWGYGKTGKSLINFLSPYHSICCIDKKFISEEQIIFFKNEPTFFSDIFLKNLLLEADLIIPSPGVIIPKFVIDSNKLLQEVDLFFMLWGKKVIAVTGSVGKTSTVHYIFNVLNNYNKISSDYFSVVYGGNIGIPLVDILKSDAELAIIELSSAQLSYSKNCFPDIAIITNIYGNHIDYHSDFSNYCEAKENILKFSKKTILFVGHGTVEKNLPILKSISYVEVENEKHYKYKKLYGLEFLPVTYNFMFKIIENFNYPFISNCFKKILQVEHRMEFLKFIPNYLVFNDSKATIMESVFSAIKRIEIDYCKKNITLIIGGLSKGIDRSLFFKKLENKDYFLYVKNIIFFGKEVILFKDLFHNFFYVSNLEEACSMAKSCTDLGDVILFSPGGSSYDLYSSYEDRGKHFKDLSKSILKFT